MSSWSNVVDLLGVVQQVEKEKEIGGKMDEAKFKGDVAMVVSRCIEMFKQGNDTERAIETIQRWRFDCPAAETLLRDLERLYEK